MTGSKADRFARLELLPQPTAVVDGVQPSGHFIDNLGWHRWHDAVELHPAQKVFLPGYRR